MKSKLSHLLKEQARLDQPRFDPLLHERILEAVRSASNTRRRVRPWRLPGIGLALALAACVVLALTLPLIVQNNPKTPQIARPQPPIEYPMPNTILALNIEPTGQKWLNALSPDMTGTMASLNEIPRFFEAQIELIQASE